MTDQLDMRPPTQWRVVSEPVSDNFGSNRSGMSVALVNGDQVEELGTVGWVRKDSANPKKKMGDVLRERVEQAQIAADELNKLEVEAMQQAKDAFSPVRAELQAELDAAGGLLATLAKLDFSQIAANKDAIDALSTIDFDSVAAALGRVEPLRQQLTDELDALRGTLDELRKLDLFRLDKARQLVADLKGLELADLEKRKTAVEPVAQRLEAEQQRAQEALEAYDDAVAAKIAELRPKKGQDLL